MDLLPLLAPHFPDLTDRQREQFAALPALYADWNAKINVVSRKDIDQLPERHVLHSLALAHYVQFPAGSRVVDIGTGGGFPMLPLAIFWPEVQFVGADATAKKLKVIEAIAAEIGLANLTTVHTRVEQFEPEASFDYAISRATAEIKALYRWAKPLLKPNTKAHPAPVASYPHGLFAWKGGDLKAEFAALSRHHRQYALADWLEAPFFATKKLIFVPM